MTAGDGSSVGASLLRALSGTRGVSGAPASGAASGEDFRRLLERASSGDLRSDLPVRAARGSGVELEDAQLERIGVALDVAQSQGATSALVTIDGRAFEVDVLTRTVRREVTLDAGDVLTGIDAVVHAGGAVGASGAASGSKVVPVPGGGGLPLGSKSVVELLASMGD